MPATLRWLGCTTFVLDVDGTTILLDAYVDRAGSAEGPGIGAADIERADWILVGHSHFDHLYGADVIARRTGATIVGSPETTRVMRELGVPRQQLITVTGGETVAIASGVSAAVYPSLHSSSWVQTVDPPVDAVLLGDLGIPIQDRMRRARTSDAIMAGLDDAARTHLEATFSLRARGDGGALLYSIMMPEGTLLFQDTAGCWTGIIGGLRPDIAILAAAGRPTSDGEPWQGSLAGFIAMEAKLLAPQTIIPGHHDDWLPGFATASEMGPIREALAAAASSVALRELDHTKAVPLFA